MPADVADELDFLAHLGERGLDAALDAARLACHVLLDHDLDALFTGRAKQRIRRVRARGEVAVGDCLLRDFIGRDYGADRQSATEVLRDRDDVRSDVLMKLEAEQMTRFAETGLRLVEDHEHAALVELLAQRAEVAGWWDDHTAGAEDRLTDETRGLAREVRVRQLHAHLEAGEAACRMLLRERAAVAIGRHDRRCRGGDDRVLASAPGERKGAREIRCRPMQTRVEADDVQTAGGLPAEIDRGFDRVAAADEEEGALERLREDLPEGLMQAQARRIQHCIAGMEQRLHRLGDHLDHARMLMAQARAHLTGLKIQIFLAVGVVDERTF